MNTRPAPSVVVIVTPAWADANNGNWQTARRWGRHLASKHTVLLTDRWPDGRVQAITVRADAGMLPHAQALIALHARRSADSVQAWQQQHGPKGLAVVLTGTDLYKDLISTNPSTTQTVRASLQAAQALVLLQDQAPKALPAEQQHKAQVIFQSTSARKPWVKTDPAMRPLRVVMVGHLREEKDPDTLQRCAALLQQAPSAHPPVLIDHLGAALEPAFESTARATQAACPHYRWLGARSHEEARRRIQRAHVLVHTSRMEGGAHVIMEAVRSGTPVLASRMDGNVGMLGEGYAGYFPVGDAQALAQALQRFQADAEFRRTLHAQCEERATLFDPRHEAQGLQNLVAQLVAT